MGDKVSHQRLRKAMTGQVPHFGRAQGQDCLPQGCFYFLFSEKMCVIYLEGFSPAHLVSNGHYNFRDPLSTRTFPSH